jgi:hypothetical protein
VAILVDIRKVAQHNTDIAVLWQQLRASDDKGAAISALLDAGQNIVERSLTCESLSANCDNFTRINEIKLRKTENRANIIRGVDFDWVDIGSLHMRGGEFVTRHFSHSRIENIDVEDATLSLNAEEGVIGVDEKSICSIINSDVKIGFFYFNTQCEISSSRFDGSESDVFQDRYRSFWAYADSPPRFKTNTGYKAASEYGWISYCEPPAGVKAEGRPHTFSGCKKMSAYEAKRAYPEAFK